MRQPLKVVEFKNRNRLESIKNTNLIYLLNCASESVPHLVGIFNFLNRIFMGLLQYFLDGNCPSFVADRERLIFSQGKQFLQALAIRNEECLKMTFYLLPLFDGLVEGSLFPVFIPSMYFTSSMWSKIL